jgi:hypothetical protein
MAESFSFLCISDGTPIGSPRFVGNGSPSRINNFRKLNNLDGTEG